MNNKLQLKMETIHQLDDSELDIVDGGVDRGFARPTATALRGRPVSSARPTGGGRVSSVRPTATAHGGGGRVSSVRPTATAVPTTRMSSVRPPAGGQHTS